MSRQSRNAGGAAVASSATRMNEYFVPRDGIDREVISADICRYLGNDALVRPGHYDNPQTGQTVQGYYITAYRNLTTAMIEDLKADSARWDSERRALANRPMNASGGIHATRGDAGVKSSVSNTDLGQYRNSETHQSRQNQGPTEPPYHQDNYRDGSFDQPRQPGSSSGYNNSPNYHQQSQQQANYPPPAGNSGYTYAQGAQHMQDPRYGQPPGQQSSLMGQSYQGQETYVGGTSHLQQQRYPNEGYNGQRPGPSGNAPPQPVYAANPPPQQYPNSGSGYQYQGHPPPSNTPQYSSMQPQDPFFGRASPAGPPQSSSGYHPQGQQLQQQYDETPPARSTASPANNAAQTSPGQPSRPNDRETNRQSSERLQRPPPRR